jgi:hypothetical protein
LLQLCLHPVALVHWYQLILVALVEQHALRRQAILDSLRYHVCVESSRGVELPLRLIGPKRHSQKPLVVLPAWTCERIPARSPAQRGRIIHSSRLMRKGVEVAVILPLAASVWDLVMLPGMQGKHHSYDLRVGSCHPQVQRGAAC